jgi:hypothetical protein
MKYPLRTHIGEPDTNRLARSKVAGTAVEKKDSTRATEMPVADGSVFSQPPIPYNAKYPFNHVFESESGHIQEFDDTPENERIHWYHKAGTYTEVDVNGTQVNRIVGDGYEIIDKNGYVYVKGALTITAEGVTNIYVNADCNLKVEGITEIDMLNDVTWNIAGNLDINVGGSTQLKTADISIETTADSIDLSSATGVRIQGEESVNLKSTTGINLQGQEAINVKSAAAVNLQSDATLSLKAAGDIAGDAGGTINLANGGSADAGEAVDAAKTKLGDPVAIGNPENNSFPQLETPTRGFEDESGFETPEDNASPEGKAANAARDSVIIGEKSTPQNTTAEETASAPKNNIAPKGASCDAIMGMGDFPKSFKLSTNVNLGMMIASPSHILQDQMAKGKMHTKQQIVCNMKGLAENCIETVMDLAGGANNIIITSGYRMNGVVAQSSATSQHPAGEAFDFQLRGKINDAQATYDFIQKVAAAVPFDQLILEYRDPGVNGNNRSVRVCWIHCSFSYGGARKMAFTMLNDKKYKDGFALL